jgi:hypothetical protein
MAGNNNDSCIQKVCKSAMKDAREKKPSLHRLQRNGQDRLMIEIEEQRYPNPQNMEMSNRNKITTRAEEKILKQSMSSHHQEMR